MEETTDRPKWLLELENRKRKPRLAHEAGAGAPCMVCALACPGLDLHFWRKICKNCKCSRDDHDFEDDYYPQFDLLFGPSKKFKKKPILLHVSSEKHHEAESAFEWVPPDTSRELAADYMKALPKEKLPIKGSAGAALRRQLLQKQLPLHDIDHKVCDELSEQEKKQFEKYLENIKNYVGQGKVTKILGARPFDRSLMTPANATDMQRFSPQHKPSTPSNVVQLRTPSSFTPKTPYPKPQYENKQDFTSPENTNAQQPSRSTPEKYSLLSTCGNSKTARSEPIKSGTYNQNRPSAIEKEGSTIGTPTKSPNSMYTSVNAEFSPLNRSDLAARQGYKDIMKQSDSSIAHGETCENARIAESILADALLPPSQVNAADIIGSTLDEKRLMFIREKLADKYGAQENQLVHSPRGLSRDLDPNDSLRRKKQGFEKEPNNSPFEERARYEADQDYKSAKAEREMIKPNSQIAQSVPLNSTLMSNLGDDRSTHPGSSSGVHDALTKVVENLERLPQGPVFSSSSEDPSNWRYNRNESPVPRGSTLDPSTDGRSQFPSSVEQIQAKLMNSSLPHNILHSENLHLCPSSVHSNVPLNEDDRAKLSSPAPSNILHSKIPQFPTSIDNVPGKFGSSNILRSDDPQYNAQIPSSVDDLQRQPCTCYPGAPHTENSQFPTMDDLQSKPSGSYSGCPHSENSQSSTMDDRSNPSSRCSQYPSCVENLQAKLSSSTIPSNVIHSQSLANQIFPHDAVGAVTRHTQNLPNVEHLRGAMEEMTMENAKQKCHKCEEDIRVGDVVVITEKAKNATWHPGCFVCDVCNELLVDLVYFHYKNKLYCGRDLANLLGIPRCFACDELIFVREYTVAEGQNYHVKHFCCWDCDVPLAGQKYITESDRPLCLPCYQKTYAKTCNACKTVIAADQQGVSVKDLNFHANEACFCCYACKKNLLQSRMAIKEEKLFCSKECISKTLRPQT